MKKSIFCFAAITCVWVSGHAASIVEFTNVETGRYLLAHDSQQVSALESGAEGAGWRRTGFGFFAPDDGQPVFRFVRMADGAPQHFFTLDAREVASLSAPGSGWILEGIPFQAYATDARGQCPVKQGGGFFGAGTIPSYPVLRNFSGALGLGHRHTTSEYERSALVSRGWQTEGIAFCAGAIVDSPIRSYTFETPQTPGAIGTRAQCAERVGSCLAVFNLPLPVQLFGPLDFAGNDAFSRLTGLGSASRMFFAPVGSQASVLPNVALFGVVMAGQDGNVGLYFDSQVRGGSPYASLAPHRQLPTTRTPDAADDRFFPFAEAFPETQLALRFRGYLATLAVPPGTHGYGHTTIEFVDRVSGRSFLFNTLVYASEGLGGDGTGFDVNLQKPIVGTSFGALSAFGRTIQGGPANPPSGSRPFDFRIDRAEFGRILAAARTSDPQLSSNPADYFVASFALKNETVGDARIGMTMGFFSLNQVARGAN